MPDKVMTIVAVRGRPKTLGSKSQMTGSAITPNRAVNTIKTAVSLSRKYLSTRNLSMWVETAHKIGPEKAYRSHILTFSHARPAAPTRLARHPQTRQVRSSQFLGGGP